MVMVNYVLHEHLSGHPEAHIPLQSLITVEKHMAKPDLSSPCIGDSESYRVYGSATSLGLEVKPLRPLAYVLLRKVISVHK